MQLPSGRNSPLYKVPVVKFDDLVDARHFPGQVFLKLDVEGSELAFLRGAGRMISQKMPRIMIELNPESLLAAGKKLHELIDFLRATEYC